MLRRRKRTEAVMPCRWDCPAAFVRHHDPPSGCRLGTFGPQMIRTAGKGGAGVIVICGTGSALPRRLFNDPKHWRRQLGESGAVRPTGAPSTGHSPDPPPSCACRGVGILGMFRGPSSCVGSSMERDGTNGAAIPGMGHGRGGTRRVLVSPSGVWTARAPVQDGVDTILQPVGTVDVLCPL